MKINKIKIGIISAAVVLAGAGLLFRGPGVQRVSAYSSGPPSGFTGAPDENSCTACHESITGAGTFSVVGPPTYVPGKTYQLSITHASTDTTRKRWGFEMTALSGATAGGVFDNITAFTRVRTNNGRSYIEHNLDGSFAGQANGANWTVQWTAPATNLGPITFWAAGNQSDNDGSTSGDRILETSTVTVPNIHTQFDYDGDNKTDASVYRPSQNAWYLLRSTTGFAAYQFGADGDSLVPADYTGDGKTDVAIWRPSNGTWYILRSEDNTVTGGGFGSAGDLAAPGDYDGDGKADLAVYRPGAQSTFFVQESTDGFVAFSFGIAEDKPTLGDFDGDGKTDFAVYRPSQGAWYRFNSSNGTFYAAAFGQAGDKVVPADYTGDGKTDIAIWRESTGVWFVLRSEDGTVTGGGFGNAGDIPAPGDYDGDGKTDFAVYRPGAQGVFYTLQSTNGFVAIPWGLAGDIPTPNVYVK